MIDSIFSFVISLGVVLIYLLFLVVFITDFLGSIFGVKK